MTTTTGPVRAPWDHPAAPDVPAGRDTRDARGTTAVLRAPGRAGAAWRRCGLRVAAAVASFVVLYALAVCTATGQWLDTRAMTHAWSLSPTLTAVSSAALARYHEATYALAAAALLAVGAWRRGAWRAAVATAVVVATTLGSQLLKHALPRPDLTALAGPLDTAATLSANSLPSGHTAGVAALAAALVVLAPARRRPLAVAVGAVAVALVGTALVVCQWHRPSDVVASVLLAWATGSVGVALVDADVLAAARRAARGLRG